MSIKINKNGKEYDLGFIPEHYPADRVYLDGDTSKTVQDAIGGLNFECTDVTFTFSNSSASAPVNLSTITNIPFAKIKYINFISFGMVGVFNGISNGSQYYCSNFTGANLTQNVTAKCLIVYES